MRFSLIICTYKRPKPLLKLLNSVGSQRLYPDEILIIDGSPKDETEFLLKENHFRNLKYFKIPEESRGLTRQRNFGIRNTNENMEIICFLDDDTVLEPNYFEHLIGTYKTFPDAVGVGGYIINEIKWRKPTDSGEYDAYEIDGFSRNLGSRNLLRKRLGLLSDRPPGRMPDFSNGLSISFLPPSGKIYPVDFFMGGVSSYKIDLFKKVQFSDFFQGYGLYEDMDFCLRASELGALYVNTAAQLHHYHEEAGRPNKFQYGKMVLLNGWYVWRLKYSKPSLKARVKWHSTAFLLTLVRLGNTINTSRKKEAFTESLGRIVGWWSLLLRKPL